jgi:hypothetical protein
MSMGTWNLWVVTSPWQWMEFSDRLHAPAALHSTRNTCGKHCVGGWVGHSGGEYDDPGIEPR